MLIDLSNFITIQPDEKLAWLDALVEAEREAQAKIVEYRDYYDGDHDTELSERMKEFLGDDAEEKFRLNQCQIVVESMIERLMLTGFEEVGQEAQGEEEIAETGPGLIEFAQKLLEDNRMDAGQEELYRQAAIDHVSYIVLDIDPLAGLITLNLNDAYTHPTVNGDDDGVKLHYANTKRQGRPLYATKRWCTTEKGGEVVRHMNIYYPDRIERYISDRKAVEMYSESQWRPDAPEAGPMAGVWPQPWIDGDGQPLGIPVVPFVNGRFSELHEVIPVQKALNKAFIDFIAACDQSGLGILFASGWIPTSDGKPITTDEEGNVTSGNEPLMLENGVILYTENPQGGLIRVQGDDLDKLIRAVDSNIIKIAQVSRTPITNFQLFGQIPAEGTQKQLEGGLIAKIESRQRKYGNAWEDLIYLARRVALGAPVYEAGQIVGHGLAAYLEFGLEMAEDARVSALWQDPIIRNEKEHLETLQIKKEMGVPLEQIFLEMGYTAEQAADFAEQAEARRVTGLMAFSGATNGGQRRGEESESGAGSEESGAE